jgi:multiple sugar transport system substrate-binding protein
MQAISQTAVAVLAGTCLAFASCGGSASHGPARHDTTCDGKIAAPGPTYVTVWFHNSTVIGAERDTLREQVRAFNAIQRQVRVKLITLPIGDYGNQVRSAAATGNLPDLLDFDGPNLYNYAWSGKLKPIDSCLSSGLRSDLLRSLREQGTYAGRMWGVGTFDSGLGMYVRTSVLKNAGVRIPSSPDDAWTADELTGILHRLRQMGYRRPLDMQLFSEPGAEWYSYGLAPAVWSAGGDLIDRADYRTVDGYLNGEPAVKALTIVQRWAQEGLLDPNRDTKSFVKGRTPISWVGHWMYDQYTQAFPGDVKIVPLPDFGRGSITGMGSWQWGITANATDGDAVWRFLSFLLSPAEVVRMTRANGAIPATKSAVRLSPRFAEGGPEHLYIRQLESGVAKPRPQTPAYPELSEAFSRSVVAIVKDLRPVEPTLDRATREVERDLADHDYYKTTDP